MGVRPVCIAWFSIIWCPVSAWQCCPIPEVEEGAEGGRQEGQVAPGPHAPALLEAHQVSHTTHLLNSYRCLSIAGKQKHRISFEMIYLEYYLVTLRSLAVSLPV